MEGETSETNKTPVENEGEKEVVNGQQSKEQELNIGDLLFVKLRKSSWWPAQLVDDNTVSRNNKPSCKRSSGDVLVRLYGSYKYMYVDFRKSRAEFKKILIENNFNHMDIMKKVLERDLRSLNSGQSRQQQSKSKGTVKTDASQNGSSKKPLSSKTQVSSKKRKQETGKTAKSHPETPKVKTKNKTQKLDGVRQDAEPSTPNLVNLRPQELSARRTKVMQSLGLIAPLGSPFPRNGLVSPSPSAC